MHVHELRALLIASIGLGAQLGCGGPQTGETQASESSGEPTSESNATRETLSSAGTEESGGETSTETGSETGDTSTGDGDGDGDGPLCGEYVVFEGAGDPTAQMPCVIILEELPDPWRVPYMGAEMDGVQLPLIESEACAAQEAGWSWIEEGLQLELCGASCENFVQGSVLQVVVGCPPAGRPVLDAGRPLLPALASAEGFERAGARAWVQRARVEAASVPAFERLAAELELLGAPGSLVERARSCAAEEREHAHLALDEARRHGAGEVLLQTQRIPARAGIDALSLLRETLVEACICETLAAHELELCAGRAREPRLRETWSRVAEQERGHAAFAWTLAAWLVGETGAAGQALIRELRSTRWSIEVAGVDEAVEGFVSDAEREQAYAQAEREAVRPALAQLLAA